MIGGRYQPRVLPMPGVCKRLTEFHFTCVTMDAGPSKEGLCSKECSLFLMDPDGRELVSVWQRQEEGYGTKRKTDRSV